MAYAQTSPGSAQQVATPQRSTVAGICSCDRRPRRCDPGAISRGAFSSGTRSRCTRSVSMRACSSAGGSTWMMPDLTVQGPKPSAWRRSTTAMVRSWCQGRAQLAVAVLSKSKALTARHVLPRKESAILPILPSTARSSLRRGIPWILVPARCSSTPESKTSNSSTADAAAPRQSWAPSESRSRARPLSPPTPSSRRRTPWRNPSGRRTCPSARPLRRPYP